MMRGDHATRARAEVPGLRFEFGALFVQVLLLVFLVLEIEVWVKTRQFVPVGHTTHRVLALLLFTPRMAFRALAIAAVAAVLCDLAFRFVVRPLMVRWYYPVSRDREHVPGLVFFQKVNESVLEEQPARMVRGRRRVAGDLMLTNHALYFQPHGWDEESWMVPLGHLDGLETRTPRRRVLNLIAGYPDHLIVTDDSGMETGFVVGAPEAVLAWFEAPVAATSVPHV